MLLAKLETQTLPLASTATENGKLNPADNPYPLPGDSGLSGVMPSAPSSSIYGNGLWA